MERMRSFIQEQLDAWEVPGCGVVAVKDGHVILNEGFGLRDIEADLPVTTKTLFAIGSTTKAFTSAAVGAMVDDGLVEWDQPLRDYLPDFKMHDPVATERVTARDLLCHRTGLPRHEFVWMCHPDRSRADLIHRLRYLPLSKDVRQAFQYCNLGYMTAGRLIEVVTGMSWENYMSTRLFKPLGMDHTNLSVNDSQSSENFSKPYERRDGKVVEIPFRPIDTGGPAGSINSCTVDMLQWLLVNLSAEGPHETDVISPETLGQMQHLHMVMDEDTTFAEDTRFGYGLGWMIGQYRGHRIVEHGGGIDGFLTECMLLPQDGVGVVVLTNSTSSSMGPVIAYRLLDELLDLDPIDWSTRLKERYDAAVAGYKDARVAKPRVEGAELPRPVEEYAGDYEHQGYGRLSIEVVDGRLVPSFGTLKVALAHRHFDVFDLEWRELTDDLIVFPLTFLTGPDGDVIALTVPFEPLLEPIRFDRRPDPQSQDPEVLRRLAGRYAMGPIEIVVGLKGERTLTLSMPGTPTVQLIPGRGLRFTLEDQPTGSLEFVLKPEGAVEKIILQPLGIFTPRE